jgi:hypothetical protein
VTALAAAITAAGAAKAAATVRIESHNDPAGASTVIHYRLQPPAPAAAFEFPAADGSFSSFGPFDGTVVVQALTPPGWRVTGIKCLGTSGAFQADVAHGTVTMEHTSTADQVCTFTNSRTATFGLPARWQATPFVPNPPAAWVPLLRIPSSPGLLRVIADRAIADTFIRVPRSSVITAQLLRGPHLRVVGQSVVRAGAGTREAVVALNPAVRRQLRRRGRRQTTFALRIIVRSGASRSVLRSRVTLPL